MKNITVREEAIYSIKNRFLDITREFRLTEDEREQIKLSFYDMMDLAEEYARLLSKKEEE